MTLHRTDGRKFEVVADGLPPFAGVQLAVDTTLVPAHRGETALFGAERLAQTEGPRTHQPELFGGRVPMDARPLFYQTGRRFVPKEQLAQDQKSG